MTKDIKPSLGALSRHPVQLWFRKKKKDFEDYKKPKTQVLFIACLCNHATTQLYRRTWDTRMWHLTKNSGAKPSITLSLCVCVCVCKWRQAIYTDKKAKTSAGLSKYLCAYGGLSLFISSILLKKAQFCSRRWVITISPEGYCLLHLSVLW